ncbi:MAG: hypothetical protein ACYCTB_10890 [bacterium]
MNTPKDQFINLINPDVFFQCFSIDKNNEKLTIQEKLLILFTAGYFSLFLLYKIKLNTLKLDAEKVRSQQLYFIAKLIILFIDNAVIYARQIATEAAESNAPPTAPPVLSLINPAKPTPSLKEINKLKLDIEPFYNDLTSEIRINAEPVRQFLLENSKIKDYILTHLARKAYYKPDLYPLYPIDIDIVNFNLNLDIPEQYLNLITASKNYYQRVIVYRQKSRAKDDILPAIHELLDLYYCQEFSINSIIWNDDEGKTTEIGDLINPADIDGNYLDYPEPPEPPLFAEFDDDKIIIRKEYKKRIAIKSTSTPQKTKLFKKICKSVSKNNKLNNYEKFGKAISLYEKATKTLKLNKHKQPQQLSFFGEVQNG